MSRKLSQIESEYEKILDAATGKRGAAIVIDLEIVEYDGKKA